jgi:5-methylcytosine-specific restriction endonuclease McrA
VLPRQQGGGNEPENLVACCLPCNKWKRSRTPEQAGMTLRPIPTLEVLHA